MIGKGIKRIITSRVFYLISAAIISVALWLYVMNVENPETEWLVSGVEVHYLGAGKEEILEDKGLFVKEEDRNTVNVTVTGRRSLVTRLTKDNMSVSVDLTDIREAGQFARGFIVTFPEYVTEKEVSYRIEPTFVTVKIDELIEQPVYLSGVTSTNIAAEGYILDIPEFTPAAVMVSGPAEIVSTIVSAEAKIERENLKRTITAQVEYVFKDAEGREVSKSELTVDNDKVTVEIPILMIKEVNLDVMYIDGGGAKSVNAKAEISPSTITLLGDPEILEAYNTLYLETINLAGVRESEDFTFEIRPPNGCTVFGGDVPQAKVSVKLSGLYTKRVIVTNMSVINHNPAYNYTIVTPSITVELRGPSLAELNNIDQHNTRIVCDVKDRDVGGDSGPAVSSFVPVVYIDGYPNVAMMSYDQKVVISITERIDEVGQGNGTTGT